MPVRRQHVVSRALLRRWAENGSLHAVRLRTGTILSRSPKAEGYVPWFVSKDYSDPVEKLWKEIEDAVPEVLAHVETGTVFQRPDDLDLLRQLFAMHFVRAKHTRLNWAELLARQAQDGRLATILAMAQDEDVLAALYEQQTGLVPGSAGELDIARERLITRLERQFGPGGEAFVDQLLSLYGRVLEYLRTRRGLEIGHSEEKELIMGDAPAVTHDAHRQTAGTHNGVPLTAADTLLLPLTPAYVLAIGGAGRYVELGDSHVDLVNQIQLVCAVDTAYVRPSAIALESWVLRQARRQ